MVGTGATAVQAIPEIAQQAKQLTVFQAHGQLLRPGPQWQGGPRTGRSPKGRLRGRRERGSGNRFFGQGALLHSEVCTGRDARRAGAGVSDPDVGRKAGSAFWLANYQDMFFSQEANDICADYIKRKIRTTVKKTRLSPKN